MTSSALSTVLAKRPLGLVFDIDGTLSPIAPTPDAATLYPGVAELLEQARAYAHVAIMTGRGIEDGARIVNLEGLTYIGTHGLEWCEGLPSQHPVELIPEALSYVEPGKQLLDLVEQHQAELPGVIVQRKRVGGSVHYRLAQDPEQTRERIFALLQEPARELQMRLGEGKKVVEVLSPLTVNKGQALRRYTEHLQLQSVLFAGDDRTDLYAIRAAEKLRQERLATVSIVVQHTDTLPELLEHANIIVQEVEGMVAQLREIVNTLVTTPL